MKLAWLLLLLLFRFHDHVEAFTRHLRSRRALFTGSPLQKTFLLAPVVVPRSSSSSSKTGVPLQRHRLTMRDTSASYWFHVGDSVRVIEPVIKAGHNLQGRRGVVMETWQKCSVDPTCCCAEQVDKNMAVRVEFSGSEDDANDTGSFTHFFAEEELVTVADDDDEAPKVKEASFSSLSPPLYDESPTAFDGMSCKAFKLAQLQIVSSKPRRIGS